MYYFGLQLCSDLCVSQMLKWRLIHKYWLDFFIARGRHLLGQIHETISHVYLVVNASSSTHSKVFSN